VKIGSLSQLEKGVNGCPSANGRGTGEYKRTRGMTRSISAERLDKGTSFQVGPANVMINLNINSRVGQSIAVSERIMMEELRNVIRK
jgi:hypothetical protein